jgi:hypothetical protein
LGPTWHDARVGAQVVRASRRDLAVGGVVLVWIPVVLWLDSGASLGQQHLLGLGTWTLLAALLSGEAALVRMQTAVVIAFATAVEYTFADLLGTYVYRLDNVPSFVPPGHGLVYLAAYAFGRSALARRWEHPLVAGTIAVGGAYALWGISPWAPRPDALGAFWYLCLVGFLLWGRSRLLYVGAFLVVTYLELVGTAVGTWAWQPYDPILGVVSMGNPPTGAAGGYGWFDLVAVATAPALLRLLSRARQAARGAAPGWTSPPSPTASPASRPSR